jgi:N6-adenosine-specific RNA methylase IME4
MRHIPGLTQKQKDWQAKRVTGSRAGAGHWEASVGEQVKLGVKGYSQSVEAIPAVEGYRAAGSLGLSVECQSQRQASEKVEGMKEWDA